MSDQTTSGAQPVAAAATSGDAVPAAAPAAQPAPVGTFGNARGSGLARGKRPVTSHAAPAATPAVGADYKPTAVEVITPVREYQNPFASEAPASIPANEPVPAPAAPVSSSLPPVGTPPAADAGTDEAPASAQAPAPELPASAAVVADEGPAEIRILPPTETPRPTVSWGDAAHADAPRPPREERQAFRPERREPREPRNFERREPRREPALEQRGPLPHEHSAAPARKSGGFIGWLKGLFGGKTDAQPATDGRPDRQGHDGEHHHHRRRRRRGGRGRGGYQDDHRGPRDGQSPEGGQPAFSNEGERRFDGGGHRRRRRGGRGRHRDHRGGPRSEGQQGGGAI